MELSENSELRAGTIGQAKSTGYFMKLRDWPEFDLIRSAGANRLIVGFKTVRTIEIHHLYCLLSEDQQSIAASSFPLSLLPRYRERLYLQVTSGCLLCF